MAAGRNDRLAGHVPAYMKPLLVVNGSTLVSHIIRNVGLAARVILVVSPDNVKPLVDIASSEREDARFVVQPQASGPVEAIRLGLDVVRSSYTMIVCGDNVVPLQHWAALLSHVRPENGHVIISTRRLMGSEVKRFTFFRNGVVFEKQDPPILEASYDAWIGPIIFRTEDLVNVMENTDPQSISDIIRTYEEEGWCFVPGECSDIGIPGELP